MCRGHAYSYLVCTLTRSRGAWEGSREPRDCQAWDRGAWVLVSRAGRSREERKVAREIRVFEAWPASSPAAAKIKEDQLGTLGVGMTFVSSLVYVCDFFLLVLSL